MEVGYSKRRNCIDTWSRCKSWDRETVNFSIFILCYLLPSSKDTTPCLSTCVLYNSSFYFERPSSTLMSKILAWTPEPPLMTKFSEYQPFSGYRRGLCVPLQKKHGTKCKFTSSEVPGPHSKLINFT